MGAEGALLMPNLGPLEIAVVFVVALVVLGPRRLPEAGRQLGKALAEVRRWSSGVQQELREAMEPEPQPLPPSPPDAAGAPGTPTPVDLDPDAVDADKPQADGRG